jgi:hypothetical protein
VSTATYLHLFLRLGLALWRCTHFHGKDGSSFFAGNSSEKVGLCTSEKPVSVFGKLSQPSSGQYHESECNAVSIGACACASVQVQHSWFGSSPGVSRFKCWTKVQRSIVLLFLYPNCPTCNEQCSFPPPQTAPLCSVPSSARSLILLSSFETCGRNLLFAKGTGPDCRNSVEQQSLCSHGMLRYAY